LTKVVDGKLVVIDCCLLAE